MKLSDKQKEVIKMMRNGSVIHWMGGIRPSCFISKNHNYKISTATCFRLWTLKLIEQEDMRSHNSKYQLTELGKTLTLI